jgi:hypothetical protein
MKTGEWEERTQEQFICRVIGYQAEAAQGASNGRAYSQIENVRRETMKWKLYRRALTFHTAPRAALLAARNYNVNYIIQNV